MRIVVTYLKKAWHWLTSMRTALVLLFVLAVAAIPGALLPQRSLNQDNVNEYIANNGRSPRSTTACSSSTSSSPPGSWPSSPC